MPGDELFTQDDNITGFLDREEQSCVKALSVLMASLENTPQGGLLANQETEGAEIG